LGDAGFWPRPWLLTPFRQPHGAQLNERQEVFNYRQSSARIIVEQHLGILKGRWRVLHEGIRTRRIQWAVTIVGVCIVLHNWLLSKEKNLYRPTAAEVQEWMRKTAAAEEWEHANGEDPRDGNHHGDRDGLAQA